MSRPKTGVVTNTSPAGKAERLKIVSVHEAAKQMHGPLIPRPVGFGCKTSSAMTAQATAATPNSPAESATTESPITIHLSALSYGAGTPLDTANLPRLLDELIEARIRPGFLPILYDHAAGIISRAIRVLPSEHRVTVKVPGQVKRRRNDM